MLSSKMSGDPGGQIKELLDRAIRNIVGTVAEGVQQNILRNVEGRILRVRTGSMVQAWSGPVRVGEDNVTGDMMATIAPARNLPYLRIHEYGGEIRPKGPWYLRFKLEDGTIIRTKLVKMPARKYLSTSVEQTRPQVKELAQEGIEAARQGKDWFGRGG